VTPPQRPAPGAADALSPPPYRPEIDGLRAIAVLLVILFHAGFRVPGGYVGVDVFFVISGYLITRLLLHREADRRLSLTLFWTGRIRRIVPALAAVLAAAAIPALLLLTPYELEEFAKSLGASALMGGNIFFWRNGGYFGRDETHLLHLWTIGIEEQFYLFYPIFLLTIFKWRASLLTPLLCLVLAVSLGAAEFLNDSKPQATFLLLPTRGWELLVGALAARFEMAFSGSASHSLPGAAPAGLALVLGSAFFYDVNTPFPGLWTLAPTLGTALLLLYARTSLAGRLLSWAPLVGIGLISYGAYLWHQPLLSFSRVALQREASVAEALVLVLLSLTLGYLSWRFVEMPLRRRPLRPRRMFAFLPQ
jgi:peptidoglycan/LPS O-acetylase OafA/YrhL